FVFSSRRLHTRFSRDWGSDVCSSDLAVNSFFATLMISQAAPIEDRYYLKAMNCPHHHKLFAAVPRSYRDLPLRLAEYGACYRYRTEERRVGERCRARGCLDS